MGAKVREKGGYYWVVIHHNRQRRWKKVGKDKRETEQLANRINALIAAGAFVLPDRRRTLRTERMLQDWYRDYRPTLSPSFARLAELNIRLHLVPHFGEKDLRDIREADLLRFMQTKLDEGLSTSTITHILSVLRRVMSLAEKGR